MRFLYILCLIIWLSASGAYSQAMDGNCHVYILSGSPALFQFNSMQDLIQGKVLSYQSIVRVYVVNPIKTWQFHVKSISPIFDGPSTLNADIVKIKVTQIAYNSVGDILTGPEPGYYTFDIKPESAIDANDMVLATGTVDKDWYKNYTLYFYVQFSVVPDDANENSQLTSKTSGYYSSQACFWFSYDY